MKCSICNEPIVLMPSAEERARKFGGSPSDYSRLFTEHSACALARRREGTSALIEKLNKKGKTNEAENG
jgi:hypothetical protein